MPELTESTILVRKSQALQVLIERMNDPHLSTEEACQRVGISSQVYRDWMHQDPDALVALRNFIAAMQLEQLFNIEMTWPVIVEELLKSASASGTKTKDRVQATKLLERFKDDLERSYNAQPGAEEDAHGFLKDGPKLSKKLSRMASVEVEPTQQGGVRVDISSYQDVIDLPDPEHSEGEE